MKRLLLLAALTLSSLQAVSQTNIGISEGRVTRIGSSEGLSDVQITLYGPGAADPATAIRAFYTPNPKLTPAMRAEIDEYLNYPYPAVIDGESPLYRMGTSPEALERAQMIAAGVPFAPLPMTPVAIPDFRVWLDFAERLTNTPFVATYTTYEPSGAFLFRNVVEGKYTVRVSPLPANGYVADVRAGGKSVFDSGFDISSQTGEVQVLVKTNGGKVQGVVRDSTGRPIASARVALVPPVSRRQNSQLYKVATSGASGSFSMNRIAPGEYKLFAWETAPDGAWLDNNFLDLYEGLGRTVVVDSATLDIELKLIQRQGGQGKNR